MMTSLSLSAINHLLAQSEWAKQRLLPHAGRTAQLDLSPWTLGFSISAEGYLAQWKPPADENADVVLKLAPGNLHLFVTGGAEALMRQVHIEGNAEFADALGFVFRHLKWDMAEDLSKVTGDIAAQRITGLVHTLSGIPRELWDRTSSNLAEYLTEEKHVITTHSQVDNFRQEITALRDAVARLEKRAEIAYPTPD